MKQKKIIKTVGMIFALYLLLSCLFVIDETERAVIIQLGVPIRDIANAGLYVKWPWPFQSLHVLEKRYIKYHSSPKQVSTRDKKILIVDTYGYFRISDGITYLKKVQSLSNAQARVDDIVYSIARNIFGACTFDEIITAKRNVIMDSLALGADKVIREYGLESPSIRIIRTELPVENKQSVYNRMIAERQRQAMAYRSEGQQIFIETKAETDRQYTEIVAAAKEESQTIRGHADAEATRIYNDAYGMSPEFALFYRSIQAAEKTLTGEGVKKYFFKGDEPHLRVIFGK